SFVTLLSVALLSVATLGQVKKPEPLPVKIPFSESRQAVVVTTKDWTATQGVAHLYERSSKNSKWKARGETFPVVLGRTGTAWDRDSAPGKATQFKMEGDGKSPAGMFPLTFAFGTSMKPESLTLPYTRLGES